MSSTVANIEQDYLQIEERVLPKLKVAMSAVRDYQHGAGIGDVPLGDYLGTIWSRTRAIAHISGRLFSADDWSRQVFQLNRLTNASNSNNMYRANLARSCQELSDYFAATSCPDKLQEPVKTNLRELSSYIEFPESSVKPINRSKMKGSNGKLYGMRSGSAFHR